MILPPGWDDPAFTWFFYISVSILGLCLGSFATALIYRIPRDIPWICESKGGKPCRSQCPSCQTTLGLFDLVPIISWLFAKGKCRHCKAPISSFYPLTEMACLILTMGLYVVWGNQWAVLPLMLLVPFLVAHIAIDWRHMILPDDINIALFILSILFLALGGAGGAWPFHVAAGIFLPFFFWAVSRLMRFWKKREALGQGDLKFLPSAGLLLGLAAIPSFLVISGVLGLLTGLYYAVTGRKSLFPFGPALVISLIIHLFLTGYGFEYTW